MFSDFFFVFTYKNKTVISSPEFGGVRDEEVFRCGSLLDTNLTLTIFTDVSLKEWGSS